MPASTYDPAARRSTPLAAIIKQTIRASGPMRLDAYMALCLSHPEHGYYASRTVLGRDGDFITAPEVSQVFGELLGLWAAVVWQSMGAPDRVALVELGPGRGTLMADALRATRRVPGFHQALDVALVETSPAMIARQKAALPAGNVTITWHDTLAAVLNSDAGIAPPPTIILANEFFDALPVRQRQTMSDGSPRERTVIVDTDGQLAFDPPEDPSAAIETHAPATSDIISALNSVKTAAFLAIDYGFTVPAAIDTLQAVRRHTYEHPLTSPGEADLTTHVDFANLARLLTATTDLVPAPPIAQGAFLGTLGIVERTEALMRQNPAQANALETATARLIAPAGMGGRFQVLGAATTDVPALPALPLINTSARQEP